MLLAFVPSLPEVCKENGLKDASRYGSAWPGNGQRARGGGVVREQGW